MALTDTLRWHRQSDLLEGLLAHSISLWMAGLGQKLRELWRRRGGAAQHSMRLLSDNLSPLQRDQLALFNYFDVMGGDTGTHYRIHLRNQLNVEVLDNRCRRLRMLCFMPRGHLPVGDMLLGQKIALELFEREVLRIANGQRVWIDSWERPPYGFRY